MRPFQLNINKLYVIKNITYITGICQVYFTPFFIGPDPGLYVPASIALIIARHIGAGRMCLCAAVPIWYRDVIS